MKQLLTELNGQTIQSEYEYNDIQQHIIKEDKSKSTIQNFYYSFKIINKLEADETLKDIFVVTSDFHMKRAKHNFEQLFFSGQQQVIGNKYTFDYQTQVHFISSATNFANQSEK